MGGGCPCPEVTWVLIEKNASHTRRLRVPPLSWERWRRAHPFTRGKPNLTVVARPQVFIEAASLSFGWS